MSVVESVSEEATPTTSDDALRGARQLRARHRFMLVMASLTLLASLLLEVVPEGRIAIRGLEAYPFPHSCASRVLFQGGCPGCGLTRSFVHLAHGRWQASVAVHRIGWLLALALLLQFPYRIVGLLAENPSPLGKTLPTVFGWTLVALLLASWCYDLVM